MQMALLKRMPMHVQRSYNKSRPGPQDAAGVAVPKVGGSPVERPCVSRYVVTAMAGDTRMHGIYNGMSAGDLDGTWRKSRRSNSQGACVEIARIGAETIAMRNSRDPQGPALIYRRETIAALIEGLRAGDFDHLVS
jgi:hypothetical protein